jgi:UDP-N-acetylmuramate: L-alanyl-gamma-D-glutamyl-meso-diaminopimelate ligase
MNLERNRIPGKVRSIHLIAVCGTGMAALACMLKDMGFAVTGSDRNVYPPMSTFLASKKINVFEGFHGDNLAYRPDLVVVGNAVSKDNPEVIQVNRMGLCFCSMPQAVASFAAKDKKIILVAGTHGKTTTASLIAWLLKTAGVDVSFVIGGILSNFESNYRLGSSDTIVIEGDEYDTAFFDKGPKFMHYRPDIAVLTSIEFDHADIFRDMDHVERIFKDFISALSPESTLVACYEDPKVLAFSRKAGCRVVGYGSNTGAAWRIKNRSVAPPRSLFEVVHSGQYVECFETGLMGDHNLNNALAALAVADQLHLPKTSIQAALKTFAGVKRRQEIRGIQKGVAVIDDFAHHPTAVRETIRAVKPFYAKGRLIAVFEPRTNTSMRDIFQNVYPDAFKDADLVCIREPSLLSKIPAEHRFSSARLVSDLQARGMNAHYFENTDRIIDFLVSRARPGDAVLIMSNGGFDNIHERLLDKFTSIKK